MHKVCSRTLCCTEYDFLVIVCLEKGVVLSGGCVGLYGREEGQTVGIRVVTKQHSMLGMRVRPAPVVVDR